MSLTFPVRTNSRPDQASVDSNASESFSGFFEFPDEGMQRALMARLIARSSDPEGFDRTVLRDLNAEAWGTPGE